MSDSEKIRMIDPENNHEHVLEGYVMFQDIIRVLIKENNGRIVLKVSDLQAVTGTPGAIKIKGSGKDDGMLYVTEMPVNVQRQ